MRRKVHIQLATALVPLLLVPVYNLSYGNRALKPGERWFQIRVLFNLDQASRFMNRLAYPWGISLDPSEVYIGKQGWLFLGDKYQTSLTTLRTPASPAEQQTIRRIADAQLAWERWIQAKGVRLYKVMLAPDKSSIYPEFLPDWVKPASPSVTDALMTAVGNDLYVDLRPVVRHARSQYAEDLFFKTDTHWNGLAGWIAYRAFAARVAVSQPDLRWIADGDVRLTGNRPGGAGDLARFLRLEDWLAETDPTYEILQAHQTEHYDFETGQQQPSVGNLPMAAPTRPLLVRTQTALNARKLLWLRDSFGVGMSPLMSATFSETLQVGWGSALDDPQHLAHLIEQFQPDYVFLTVVERSSRAPEFTNGPLH